MTWKIPDLRVITRVMGAQREFTIDLSVPVDRIKTGSTFYPPPVVERIRQLKTASAWAKQLTDTLVADAEPWSRLTEDELWAIPFAPGITRAWSVWDHGWCPACRQSVPLYDWKVHAVEHPWKVLCPHCAQVFPTNDFEAYYRSGLEPHGRFEASRADRRLLFNTQHPDPADPLHRFGVDDGDGCVDAENHRWRFIGAYLIYGQWKQLVVGGVHRLAAAYLVTGESSLARKAAVLLDRVADFYPDFDYLTQAVEKTGGYVSMWHDSCGETRALTMAYDMIFDGIRDDRPLVEFLSAKADRAGLDNRKRTFRDIQRNIEHRILRDACNHRPKIMCNYPQSDFTLAVLIAVLGWPDNREAVRGLLDWTVLNSTQVDGTSGEKGMTDYSSFTVGGLGQLLALFDSLDASLLPWLIQEHPALRDTFKFHPDVRSLGRYYPQIGDGGSIAHPAGPLLTLFTFKQQGTADVFRQFGNTWWVIATVGLTPSMFTFLWRLYELTGDPCHVQRLVAEAGEQVDDLPFDLTCGDAAGLRAKIRLAIERHDPHYRPGSVLKRQWHLGILRSGVDERERAAWLHYDTAGMWHGHSDGMNLGLFAKGLDLMPDFGYPPGHFPSERVDWYKMVAAHNTVAVDGRQFARFGPPVGGEARLWATGSHFRLLQVAAPDMLGAMEIAGGSRYERTVALIDLSETDSYVVDVFRVAGGRDHAKFTHAYFGKAAHGGLSLAPAEPYGHATQLRHFQADPAPRPGWWVDVEAEDRYRLLPAGQNVHVRVTDLTEEAQAILCEGWVTPGPRFTSEEVWIPFIITRRQSATAPLASTFVSVVEPYGSSPTIQDVRRHALADARGNRLPPEHVALELALANGTNDTFILSDPSGNSLAPSVAVPDLSLRLDGECAWVRRDRKGGVSRLTLVNAASLEAGALQVRCTPSIPFLELEIDGETARVISPAPAPQGLAITRSQKPLKVTV